MKKYAILVYKDTGLAGVSSAFIDDQIPTVDLLPPDKDLVEFDETHPDYEMLYTMLVDDTTGAAAEYLPAVKGGVVYQKNTGRFEFVKAPTIDTRELIRNMRNDLIRNTDDLMLVPDLPQSLKDELLAYRQALRDMTNGVTSTTDPASIVWPKAPGFI